MVRSGHPIADVTEDPVRSRLLGAALAAISLLSSALPTAAATTPTAIFVDHLVTCSDTAATRGTLALPFCTIQAAVNAALPGQTVQIDPTEQTAGFHDTYKENVAVTHSGSPGAPITISGGGSGDPDGPARILLTGPLSGARLPVRLTAVHDVTFDGFMVEPAPTSLVTIADSADVTLSHDVFSANELNVPSPAVAISGASDHVTLTKDTVFATTTAIAIGTGASDTVLSDDAVLMEPQSAVSAVTVAGATGTVLTNDTVTTGSSSVCVTTLAITGGSIGASVQNNIFAARCTTVPLVSVSADSVTGTTVDYNIVHTAAADPQLYSWAGTGFATSAALTTATGQGVHDLDGDPQANGVATPAATIVADSANPDAPDTPSTDVDDVARVDDPLAPNTLGGIIDRGAIEMRDPLTAHLAQSASQAPVGGTVVATGSSVSPWAPITGYTVNFGDGIVVTVPPESPSVSHVYTKTGFFPVTVTATDALGTTATVDDLGNSAFFTGVRIVPADTPVVVRAQQIPQGGQGVLLSLENSSGPWNFTSSTCDWGDGTSTTVQNLFDCSHVYPKLGTYPITVTLHDAGGNDRVGTTTFTTPGTRFVPLSPKRLLDTRNGTGTGGRIAKVAAGGTLKLKVAGVDSIPVGVRAVAMTVTVTDTATSGNVSTYPDGIAKPLVSTVNFVKGQTVPNLTIVSVGTDGDVDLSTAGGPVDLIADVTGYFVTDSAANGYTAITSHRVLDTRNGTGNSGRIAPIAARGTFPLAVAGAGIPATGVTAVALNVTVTGPKSTGFITAFPDGTARPTTSSSNFVTGQTVADLVIVPVGADGKVDLFNGSPGTTDLVADVVGYFQAKGGDTYVPMAPSRAFDTRQSAPIGARKSVDEPSLPDDLSGGVVMNLTVTGGQQVGFLLVGPSPLPAGLTSTASTLNWDHVGETIANLAIPTSAGPFVSVFNGSNGTTNAIGDVLGYFDPTTPQP
ncbi:MAG TPA: PKD domain-containing protein [Pseudonocardiaceae bacterium]